MPAPAALLDECPDLALVGALRARGFDVVSLLVVGPRGVNDASVLERAAELGRVLVTQNTVDFKKRHAEWQQQGRMRPGIVCVPQTGEIGRRAVRIAMLLDWIATQPHASRLFV